MHWIKFTKTKLDYIIFVVYYGQTAQCVINQDLNFIISLAAIMWEMNWNIVTEIYIGRHDFWIESILQLGISTSVSFSNAIRIIRFLCDCDCVRVWVQCLCLWLCNNQNNKTHNKASSLLSEVLGQRKIDAHELFRN